MGGSGRGRVCPKQPSPAAGPAAPASRAWRPASTLAPCQVPGLALSLEDLPGTPCLPLPPLCTGRGWRSPGQRQGAVPAAQRGWKPAGRTGRARALAPTNRDTQQRPVRGLLPMCAPGSSVCTTTGVRRVHLLPMECSVCAALLLRSTCVALPLEYGLCCTALTAVCALCPLYRLPAGLCCTASSVPPGGRGCRQTTARSGCSSTCQVRMARKKKWRK